MLNVIFLPSKRAPSKFKPVTYHVNQYNHVTAEKVARSYFVNEHDYKYYDRVVIAETRILRGLYEV